MMHEMAEPEIKLEPYSPPAIYDQPQAEWSEFEPIEQDEDINMINESIKSEVASTNPKTCKVLKKAIMSRRRASGVGDLKNLFHEPKKFEVGFRPLI